MLAASAVARGQNPTNLSTIHFPYPHNEEQYYELINNKYCTLFIILSNQKY